MTDDTPAGRITVPEPASGMGSGFLTEYWNSKERLPRIKKFEIIYYFVKRSFTNMFALPMSNAITVMTMAITLFLFAGFLLVLQNVDKIISRAGNSLHLTMYLKSDAAEKDVNNFLRELENNSGIASVEFISKKQALQLLKADFGARSGFLEGFEDDNPLPPSVDVTLHPDELGIQRIEQTIQNFRERPFVDEVIYGSEWVQRIQGLLRIFRIFGVIVLLVVLSIIIFLISNTIKLVIYSRRDEIGIMRLVGATEGFVRTPFVIGGVVQGLVGSAIGVTLLWFAFLLVNIEIHSSSLFGIAMPQISFLGLFTSMAIILSGAIIGGVGSFFALGKLLDV